MGKLENLIFHLVSYPWPNERFTDRQSPPLSNDTLRIPFDHSADPGDAYVACLLNDAHEIWFGYPRKWLLHMSRRDFHKVIRWYLWRWARGEWFGIRRKLFYVLLHRRVNASMNRSRYDPH